MVRSSAWCCGVSLKPALESCGCACREVGLDLALDVASASGTLAFADLRKSSRSNAAALTTPHNTTMAPTKPSSKGKSGPKGKSAGASKSKPRGKEPEGISKRKQKSLSLAKPGGAQKTKSYKDKNGKKKKRVYTEAELDIPKLNSIVPAGIAKPKGQKKGKVFVDDPASMMAIMSVVNAQKEGHIESKIMRARQLEEIREAKRKEAEGRLEDKKADFVSSPECWSTVCGLLLIRCRRIGSRASRRRGRGIPSPRAPTTPSPRRRRSRARRMASSSPRRG